jgi:hypothetical protein
MARVDASMPIPLPGPGPYVLTLSTISFYLLVGTLGLFVVLLLILRGSSRGRRALAGYLDAAGVSLGFLVFAVGLVVYLVDRFPAGNLAAFALYSTILSGYWLAFAIPVVTVGASVQSRSRGSVRWVVPTVLASALAFGLIAAYYYAHP